MKRIILIISIALMSCSKEYAVPCVKVVSHSHFTVLSSNRTYYKLRIEDKGATKEIYVNREEYVKAVQTKEHCK